MEAMSMKEVLVFRMPEVSHSKESEESQSLTTGKK
jgi:hypothetical protein